jgi:hypothetical protein
MVRDKLGDCMQVMVANVRCEEIMIEKLSFLKANEEWQHLAQEASSHLVPEFGLLATALLGACLSGIGFRTNSLTTTSCTTCQAHESDVYIKAGRLKGVLMCACGAASYLGALP